MSKTLQDHAEQEAQPAERITPLNRGAVQFAESRNNRFSAVIPPTVDKTRLLQSGLWSVCSDQFRSMDRIDCIWADRSAYAELLVTVMSNFYLDRLYTKQQRKKAKEEQQAPADTSNLGAAIEQLIDSAVEERVEAAMEKQRPLHNPKVPRHLQPFTQEPFSDTFPAAPPRAKPVMPAITMQRDAAGKIRSCAIGDMTFTVQRDGAGRAIFAFYIASEGLTDGHALGLALAFGYAGAFTPGDLVEDAQGPSARLLDGSRRIRQLAHSRPLRPAVHPLEDVEGSRAIRRDTKLQAVHRILATMVVVGDALTGRRQLQAV